MEYGQGEQSERSTTSSLLFQNEKQMRHMFMLSTVKTFLFKWIR